MDLEFRLSSKIALLGEGYTGANTATYFGAVLNGDTLPEVRSLGGWVNLQAQVSDRLSLSLGGGMDDLTNEDDIYGAAADVRIRNTFGFANLLYALRPGVKTGVEVSGWITKYLSPSAGFDESPTDMRVQWTLQGGF